MLDLDADGVRVRLYRPDGAEPGVVVHLHGGGFVFHDLDVHDRLCRRFANRLGMAVLSVDYRLAPEHRFPAAPDDVDTVLAWLDHDGAALEPAARRTSTATARAATSRWSPRSGTRAGSGAAVLHYPFLDPTRRLRVVRRSAPRRRSTRARRAGTGSSTPPRRPT